jgi:hypothetical protein
VGDVSFELARAAGCITSSTAVPMTPPYAQRSFSLSRASDASSQGNVPCQALLQRYMLLAGAERANGGQPHDHDQDAENQSPRCPMLCGSADRPAPFSAGRIPLPGGPATSAGCFRRLGGKGCRNDAQQEGLGISRFRGLYAASPRFKPPPATPDADDATSRRNGLYSGGRFCGKRYIFAACEYQLLAGKNRQFDLAK